MATDGQNPLLLVSNGFITTGKTPPMDMTTGLATNKAVKTPMFETDQCHCREVVEDPMYYNIAVSFKCLVHGQVHIDRRPLPIPLPQANPFAPQPMFKLPKSFPEPQWGGNGAWGGGVNANVVGDFANAEMKAVAMLTGKTAMEPQTFTAKLMQIDPETGIPVEYDPMTDKPGDPV